MNITTHGLSRHERYWGSHGRHALQRCTISVQPGGWTTNRGIDYGKRMLNMKLIDDLARQISETIPAGMKELQGDVTKNIRTLLEGTLAKLDLVTREEFDAQSKVLARTRNKLEQLEKTIAELEQKNL